MTTDVVHPQRIEIVMFEDRHGRWGGHVVCGDRRAEIEHLTSSFCDALVYFEEEALQMMGAEEIGMQPEDARRRRQWKDEGRPRVGR